MLQKVTLLTIISTFLLIGTSTAQRAEQDCFFAKRILCNAIYTDAGDFDGPGENDQEVNPAGAMSSNGFSESCLKPAPAPQTNSGEKNSIWYTFIPQVDGLLNFTITPTDMSADFDWAVYNLDNAPPGTEKNDRCLSIYENNSTMTALDEFGAPACNSSSTAGSTGANGGAGAQNSPRVQVFAGNQYVICLVRWSTLQTTFDVDFTATDPALFDTIPPRIDAANQEVVLCTETSFKFTFDEEIDCSTISTGEIQITDVATGTSVPVSSITGTFCNPGTGVESTGEIDVTIAGNFPGKGVYEVTVVNGSDGNTLADPCLNPENFIPNGTVIGTFNVGCAEFAAPLEVCATQSATFGEDSGGDPAWTYEWDFDNNGTYETNGDTVDHTFPSAGVQDVTLRVTKPGVATPSTFTVAVDVTNDCIQELYWPTAFSPDGANPVYGPTGVATPPNYEMIIVNRWGEIVYRAADINDTWDGTVNGKKASPGVYVVYGKYEKPATDGSIEIVKYGNTITLIR